MKIFFKNLFRVKKSLITIWFLKETVKVIYNYLFVSFISYQKKPKPYYGGSILSNVGGPSVKIKKLNLFFPENNWNFNIIYLLSNSINLNSLSINLIKKKGLPIVLNQNGVFYPSWFDGNWEKENLKMSKIYHSANYVFWQSNFCKKTSEKFLGKRIGEGEILYNAIDTSFFTPKNKLFNNRFTFLITGNLRKINNYRVTCVLGALKTLIAENKNIELIIAGFIEDKNYLYKEISKLKLEDHIIFQKPYTQKEAPEIYNQADAYITMTYKDNCPTAVLEAMSCGLPIIYSASGGIPELVDNYSGIGLEVESSWSEVKTPKTSKIVNGMKKIIENKKFMSEAARIRAVENFDIKFWKKRHEFIFNFLVRK